jgi:hypothetical protein
LASTMLHLLYFCEDPVHIIEQVGKASGPFCITWRISPRPGFDHQDQLAQSLLLY